MRTAQKLAAAALLAAFGATAYGIYLLGHASVVSAKKKAEEEMLRNHQAGIDTFQRAFAACMDARNYSVK